MAIPKGATIEAAQKSAKVVDGNLHSSQRYYSEICST